MSLREHPFLYQMSGAPCKCSVSAGVSSYHMPFMIWMICAIVTEQSHVLNRRLFVF